MPVRERLGKARQAVRERVRRAWRAAREHARAARTELRALAVAMTDPRTPWYAKAVAGITVGLAASPVDPIPDFLPAVGHLDDLVFVPVGVSLARRAIPEEVLADARAADADPPAAARLLGALVVVLGWAAVLAAAGWLLLGS